MNTGRRCATPPPHIGSSIAASPTCWLHARTLRSLGGAAPAPPSPAPPPSSGASTAKAAAARYTCSSADADLYMGSSTSTSMSSAGGGSGGGGGGGAQGVALRPLGAGLDLGSAQDEEEI